MDTTSLTNGALALECNVNPNIDPSCSCLLSGGGPQLNTDIAGPGIRISFYLQALFLGLLSARSESAEEYRSSLYTLICINIAMVLSSFILGFKSEPGMSLQDAFVVIDLDTITSMAIVFSYTKNTLFWRRDTTLRLLYILHVYLFLAFTLAVLITASTFGATAQCNSSTIAVFFGSFRALDACRIYYAIALLIYSVFLILSHKNDLTRLYQEGHRRVANQSRNFRDDILKLYGKFRERKKPLKGRRTAELAGVSTSGSDGETCRAVQTHGADNVSRDSPQRASRAGNQTEDEKPDKRTRDGRGMREEYEESEDDGTYKLPISGRLLCELIVILIMWTPPVVITELTIVANGFYRGGVGLESNLWGFGQVLPMFLIVLPLADLVKAFKKRKLGKRHSRKPSHRTPILRDFFDGLKPNLDFGRVFKRSHGRHGHSHGSELRPVPRIWNGNGRRIKADFMPSLWQPAPHVSVDALHFDSPNYGVYTNTNRTGDRPGSSESSLSTYRTADDAV